MRLSRPLEAALRVVAPRMLERIRPPRRPLSAIGTLGTRAATIRARGQVRQLAPSRSSAPLASIGLREGSGRVLGATRGSTEHGT